jgi:DNA-directed RNA polymerase subunit K/omega
MNYHDVDHSVDLAGGRFAFAVLLQKRVRELVRGARPLVEAQRTHIDTALLELREGKINLKDAPQASQADLAKASAVLGAKASAGAASASKSTESSVVGGGGIL